MCPAPGGDEVFIVCRSAARRTKERAIHDRFEQRITEGLEKIAASCRKHTQSALAIAQRVGRLLGSNSRAAKLFHVDVAADERGAAAVTWTMSSIWRDWARLSEGCYVLRSNLVEWTAEDLWTAYIHLTDAETAFRIQKSDLELRPIWHQKETRVQAHILVCFLALCGVEAPQPVVPRRRPGRGATQGPRRAVADSFGRCHSADPRRARAAETVRQLPY